MFDSESWNFLEFFSCSLPQQHHFHSSPHLRTFFLKIHTTSFTSNSIYTTGKFKSIRLFIPSCKAHSSAATLVEGSSLYSSPNIVHIFCKLVDTFGLISNFDHRMWKSFNFRIFTCKCPIKDYVLQYFR